MYYSKQECYEDVYLSLKLGMVSEEDIQDLLVYYEELEYYECCSGITTAYNDYKDGIKRENVNR